MIKRPKDEWKNRIKVLSTATIHCILRNYTNTTKVRILIIKEPLKEDKVLQFTVNTYDDFKQNFKFYIRDFEDITEICIYEQTMSIRNVGKNLIIEENNIITSLEDNKIEGYEKSIIGFLLANIEW